MSVINEYQEQNQKLFTDWKKRDLHLGKPFIEDGIVNPDVWFSTETAHEPKILFVLKEAYGESYSLCDSLREKGPWGNIWKRVAEWTYGIQQTSAQYTARYMELDWNTANELLSHIAVMNLKKSDGKSNSTDDNLKIYADGDAAKLQEQFRLIDPTVVICGSTFSLLNDTMHLGMDKKRHHNDNWYYWDSDGRLYLDFYHPANQYPALLNYYAIASIYQQAIIEKSAGEA